jgi:DDE superfamily endonuclease
VIELWAEDEHRVGLKPIQRRVWAPKGQRPIATIHQRYQWEYVSGFVHPASGQASFTVLPTVSAPAMNAALARFAADAGLTTTHRAALVLDRAGWHTAQALVLPEGIDLIPLPPASPELQPAERVWPLINEALANRAFADLDALEAVLVDRCRTLLDDPATLQALTAYHWWPADIQPGAKSAA